MLWGTMGFWVRELNGRGLVSMDIVFLRSAVTVIIMLAVLLLMDRKLLRIKFRDLWCFAGTGLCSIVFFNFCYFKAIMLTALSVAAVLLYTAPAFVILFSALLFHEKITVMRIAALVMMFTGCCLVTGVVSADNNVSMTGLLCGLGAGLGYALYSVFGRYAIERGYNCMTVTFYTFLFASAGSFILSDREAVVKYVTADPGNAVFSLVFAAVCTVVPYLLYTAGLKHVDNGRASIIASIEPVMAAVLGILFFNESMSASSVIGFVMVIAALVISGYDQASDSRGTVMRHIL